MNTKLNILPLRSQIWRKKLIAFDLTLLTLERNNINTMASPISFLDLEPSLTRNRYESQRQWGIWYYWEYKHKHHIFECTLE